MDTVTPERRSKIMSAIRSRNTAPERRVRSALHRAGLRFRVHRAGLPGKPDIVLPRAKICVFVQGCFWHGCRRCVDGRRRVRSNTEFWLQKVYGNRARDARNVRALRADGWKVFLVWECETELPDLLRQLVAEVTAESRHRLRLPLRRAEA